MRIAITGSTGFIGTAVVERLKRQHHEIARLVRNRPVGEGGGHDAIAWSIEQGMIEADKLERVDAVIHLAGENIVGRWNEAKKTRIRRSRVDGTSLLSRTLAGLSHPPRVLLSASAIGIYGHRRDEEMDESSEPGSGFLVDVAHDWERATGPAQEAGIRVVNMRFGIVLSRRGGALAKMLPAFRLGIAGVLGSGEQYMSWIHLDDVIGAMQHCMEHENISGPVNFTAPEPVTNRTFTKTLGHVLHRPTVLPVPGFALKLALGEMSQELLGGACVMPRRLMDSGYAFRYPRLDEALQAEVHGPPVDGAPFA